MEAILEEFKRSYVNITENVDIPTFDWNDVMIIYPLTKPGTYTTYSIIVATEKSTEEYIHRFVDNGKVIKYINPQYKPTAGYKIKNNNGTYTMLEVIAMHLNYVFHVTKHDILMKKHIDTLIVDNTIRNLNLL